MSRQVDGQVSGWMDEQVGGWMDRWVALLRWVDE